MDKFKQLLMVKKLRFAPNSSTPEELSNYFKSQEFDQEIIEEVYRIVNNPVSSLRPSVKLELNDAILKALKQVPYKPTTVTI